MTFNRGDVVWCAYPGDDGRVIEGPHMAVVLHDGGVPANTVITAPISSAENPDGTPRPLLPSDVILEVANHPFLQHKSYVKTRQIITVTRSRLRDVVGALDQEASIRLSLAIVEVLDLREVVEALIDVWIRRIAESLAAAVE